MPSAPRSDSRRDVFINCPFDSGYKPTFDAIVFAISDFGFKPRSALELVDSAENRLERISQIVRACEFAVHDISRTELDARSGLPRFNMRFELGLFLGARRFGDRRQRRKNCLVLDKSRFRYQRFLSDIAGQDIAGHGNSPHVAVTCVRNWLCTVSRRSDIPGADYIWRRYRSFEKDLPLLTKALKLKRREVQFRDLCNLIAYWLVTFAPA